MRSATALLLLLLTTGCPSRGPETEETLRKRERDALAGRVDSWKVTLYRALKTSMRALPPYDRVQGLVAGKTELTREEWIALLQADPELATYKDRAGFFIVGSQLREAGHASALDAVRLLGAKGGSLPITIAPLTSFPATARPFGSAAVFYRECQDLIADDEDRYPTLTVALLPGELAKAAREKTGPFASSPLDRFPVVALEHTVLGCAWLAFEADLALYELGRARTDELLPVEELVLRAARAGLFARERFPYHALDELAAIEGRREVLAKGLAALPQRPPAPGEEPARDDAALIAGLVHLGRVEILTSLGKKEDAARELALAESCLKGAEHLRVAAHLFAAQAHVDRHEFGKAAEELRTAALALKADAAKQEELRGLVAKLEKELPDSFGPVDLARWVVRLLEADLRERVLPASSTELGARFRDAARARLGELEKAFPSTDAVAAKARDLSRQLRESVAGTSSASK